MVVLREKLLTGDSIIAKNYLNLLIDEIVVEDQAAHIKGSYTALADTMQKIKLGTKSVPSFNLDWCARRESNPRPGFGNH